MTKNPFDIIKRASDILRALNKGVLVTAKAGDKVNSMVIEWGTLGSTGESPFSCAMSVKVALHANFSAIILSSPSICL